MAKKEEYEKQIFEALMNNDKEMLLRLFENKVDNPNILNALRHKCPRIDNEANKY